MAMAPAILTIIMTAIGSKASGMGIGGFSVKRTIDEEQGGKCKKRAQERKFEPDFPLGLIVAGLGPLLHGQSCPFQ